MPRVSDSDPGGADTALHDAADGRAGAATATEPGPPPPAPPTGEGREDGSDGRAAEGRPADGRGEGRGRLPLAPAAATPSSDGSADLPEDRYLNRELSWLEFNARVLALAEDPSQPLLERAKFLAIFASNLDEFYMVRVAGLKRREETGPAVRSADGLTPREQLAPIADAQPGAGRAARPAASSTTSARRSSEAGRPRRRAGTSSTAERPRAAVRRTSRAGFPVLTPLAVDPAHPFPYISDCR